MKILEISALPLWSMEGKGGMPSFNETLGGHMRGGHEILLILPRYHLFSDTIVKLKERPEDGFKVHWATCCWFPLLSGIRGWSRRFSGDGSIPYPLRWLLNMLMLLLLTLSLGTAAHRVCRRGFKPDLVYAHNQYAVLAGYVIRCFLGIPNITRLYGTFLADLMEKPLVAIRYPTAAAGYLVPASLIICGNDGTRGDEVAKKFRITPDRFRFWQNGIAPPSQPPTVGRQDLVKRFGSPLRPDSKWIISCSRLSYWKRIDRMLYALAGCKDNGIDCQLLVAGDGDEKPTLQKLANELGVHSHVVWLGAVAHEDVWAMMNAADMFMITNDVTNRCNPLYEAAWAGLPVVTIFDPSTSDLLHDNRNALLADKDDTVELGRKLALLCENDALAMSLRNEQKKLSSTFWTWEERMRAELLELEKLGRCRKLK